MWLLFCKLRMMLCCFAPALSSFTRVPLRADLSPEFEDTWEFLDRRIGDIVEAGKALNELSQVCNRPWRSTCALERC